MRNKKYTEDQIEDKLRDMFKGMFGHLASVREERVMLIGRRRI